MTSSIKSVIIFVTMLSLLVVISACKETVTEVSDLTVTPPSKAEVEATKTELSEKFKEYWYAGEAEITSYKLEQVRYGEIRQGTAVLIFVTEDFLPEVQVKADYGSEKNTSVLKLNATKYFNTGIYPYSIMESTFFPVSNQQHATKISASIQEWCGQVYMQLNNRDAFEITSHSYFEGEADQKFELEPTWTENELWTKLRVDPKSLPTGSLKIIPALEYLRLSHKTAKAYNASAELKDGVYQISYADLNRTLSINYDTTFPHNILGWEETTTSGQGTSLKTLTTKATQLKSIKSAYWTKNTNADSILRITLELE